MAFVGAWRRSAIVRAAAECCCCAGGRWQLGLPGCRRLSVHGGVLWLSGWLRSVAIVLMGVGSLDPLASLLDATVARVSWVGGVGCCCCVDER